MKTRGFEVVSKYQGRGIELPQRKTAASAGYDLEAAERAVIEPQQMAPATTCRGAHGRHRAGADGDGADGTQGVHAER